MVRWEDFGQGRAVASSGEYDLRTRKITTELYLYELLYSGVKLSSGFRNTESAAKQMAVDAMTTHRDRYSNEETW